jgi:opacity protein-like surface antigen
MKRLVLVLVVLAAWAWPAVAQDTPTLSNLEIAVWPEFDRPEVLVIYRGLFEPETPLPVPVEIRIPARVGEPTAVAYVGQGGQRFNLENSTRVEGDWLVVSFELPTLGFQLEYYDTLPTDSEGGRTYTYGHTADYVTEALKLEFQVPPTAEGFALDPPADSVAPGTDGLTYHQVQVGPVDAGDTESWTFVYRKADSDLTVSSFVQPEAAAPPAPAASTPTVAGSDNSTVLIFLIAFVALVGVGAGAFWLGRRTQVDTAMSSTAARRPKRRGSGYGQGDQRLARPSSTGGETIFCYKCGAQLRSDSDFCHGCGTSVRES